MCLGKAQFAGKVEPDNIAVEQDHRPEAVFYQLGIDDLRQGRFAGTGKPCEEQSEALLACWRVGAAHSELVREVLGFCF